MVSRPVQPASRYRRRILGIGVFATGALYVIGAPIFAERIETDLERRVPSELSAIGFGGVTASFSGQDGVLSCERPLDDPEGARAAAYDVRGVRTIEIERSCRVLAGDADVDADGTAAAPDTARVPPDDAPETVADDDAESSKVSDEASTGEAEGTVESTSADLADVVEIVAADPDLAFLSRLLTDGSLPSLDGPITLFAPSNAAFDMISADVVADLENEPALLAAFLEHHTVAGAVTSGDLVDGALTALDGTDLTVAVGERITVGGATIVTADITASNGVVHVIDRVLLVPDFDEAAAAAASATLADAAITVRGVLASEVERNLILTAAADALGAEAVADETTIDPDTGIDAATADALAVMVAAMPSNLVSGEVGFDGSALYANGVYRTEATRDAFMATATSVGSAAALEAPPAATSDDANDLTAQLNAFVVENPIRFQPASNVLDDSASAVLDRVAADVQSLGGIAITIVGHTDSDGDPSRNLELSRERADAVRDALIERGVSAESIEATGAGSEQPILIDGVEDKGASRRVEFRVVAR